MGFDFGSVVSHINSIPFFGICFGLVFFYYRSIIPILLFIIALSLSLSYLFAVLSDHYQSINLPSPSASAAVPSVSPPLFVFITGCSSGIGYYSVYRLLSDDYYVIATVRSDRDRKRLIDQCPKKDQGRLFVIIMDLGLLGSNSNNNNNNDNNNNNNNTNTNNVMELTQAISSIIIDQHQGYLISVIHNAANITMGSLFLLNANQINTMIDCNIRGIVILTQALVPLLHRTAKRKNNSNNSNSNNNNNNSRIKPRLIFIGSGSSVAGTPGLSVYAGGKSFVDTFCSSIRYELNAMDAGIAVIHLVLGSFETSAKKHVTRSKGEAEGMNNNKKNENNRNSNKKEQENNNTTTNNNNNSNKNKLIANNAEPTEFESSTVRLLSSCHRLNDHLFSVFSHTISYDSDLSKCYLAIKRAIRTAAPLTHYYVGNDVAALPLLNTLVTPIKEWIVGQIFVKSFNNNQ